MNDYQKIVESDLQTFINNYDTRPINLNIENRDYINVIHGKNVLIGENVKIGTNCWIGHNTIIEKNVEIGENCSIGSNTIIRNSIIKDNVNILDNCTISTFMSSVVGLLENSTTFRNKFFMMCQIFI